MNKLEKLSTLFLILIFLVPSALAMFTQPDKVIQEQYNPQDLNHYQFVRNNPYKYTDPNGLWTVQVGGSLTSGFGGGGTVGGGIIFGHSKAGGFQLGHYSMLGGGAHAGGTASLTLDISGSANDYVGDISGDTATIGGSGDFGASIGGEVNIPIKDDEEEDDEDDIYIHPSGTVNVGLGIGVTPGEGHVYLVNTRVSQWLGGSRSSGGGSGRSSNWAVPVYVKSDGTVVWGAPGTKAPSGTTPYTPPKPKTPQPTVPKPKKVG